MAKKSKRLLAFVLVLVMAVSLVSAALAATSEQEPAHSEKCGDKLVCTIDDNDHQHGGECYEFNCIGKGCPNYDYNHPYSAKVYINTNYVEDSYKWTSNCLTIDVVDNSSLNLKDKSYDSTNGIISVNDNMSLSAADGAVRAAVATMPSDEDAINLLGNESQVKVLQSDLVTLDIKSAAEIKANISDYTVYWYVLKYQSDAIHIDGVIAEKYTYYPAKFVINFRGNVNIDNGSYVNNGDGTNDWRAVITDQIVSNKSGIKLDSFNTNKVVEGLSGNKNTPWYTRDTIKSKIEVPDEKDVISALINNANVNESDTIKVWFGTSANNGRAVYEKTLTVADIKNNPENFGVYWYSVKNLIAVEKEKTINVDGVVYQKSESYPVIFGIQNQASVYETKNGKDTSYAQVSNPTWTTISSNKIPTTLKTDSETYLQHMGNEYYQFIIGDKNDSAKSIDNTIRNDSVIGSVIPADKDALNALAVANTGKVNVLVSATGKTKEVSTADIVNNIDQYGVYWYLVKNNNDDTKNNQPENIHIDGLVYQKSGVIIRANLRDFGETEYTGVVDTFVPVENISEDGIKAVLNTSFTSINDVLYYDRATENVEHLWQEGSKLELDQPYYLGIIANGKDYGVRTPSQPISANGEAKKIADKVKSGENAVINYNFDELLNVVVAVKNPADDSVNKSAKQIFTSDIEETVAVTVPATVALADGYKFNGWTLNEKSYVVPEEGLTAMVKDYTTWSKGIAPVVKTENGVAKLYYTFAAVEIPGNVRYFVADIPKGYDKNENGNVEGHSTSLFTEELGNGKIAPEVLDAFISTLSAEQQKENVADYNGTKALVGENVINAFFEYANKNKPSVSDGATLASDTAIAKINASSNAVSKKLVDTYGAGEEGSKQINSNDYRVAWYVLKYESNGWHIDGAIVPVEHESVYIPFQFALTPVEELEEEDTPLAETPEEDPSEPAGDPEEEITDDPTALADAPSAVTGDSTMIFVVLVLVSGTALVATVVVGKKRNEK